MNFPSSTIQSPALPTVAGSILRAPEQIRGATEQQFGKWSDWRQKQAELKRLEELAANKEEAKGAIIMALRETPEGQELAQMEPLRTSMGSLENLDYDQVQNMVASAYKEKKDKSEREALAAGSQAATIGYLKEGGEPSVQGAMQYTIKSNPTLANRPEYQTLVKTSFTNELTSQQRLQASLKEQSLGIQKARLALQKAKDAEAKNSKNVADLLKVKLLAGNMLSKSEKSLDTVNQQNFNTQSKLATAASIALAEASGDITMDQAFDIAMEVISNKADGQYAGTPIYGAVASGMAQQWADPGVQPVPEDWELLKKVYRGMKGLFKAAAPDPTAPSTTPPHLPSSIQSGATTVVPFSSSSTSTSTEKKVIVTKNGKQFRLPERQLQQAISEGYTQVQ